MRTQFLLSILMSCVIAGMIVATHVVLDSSGNDVFYPGIYLQLKIYLNNYFGIIIFCTLVINLVEILLHVFTAFKFLKIDTYIPYGSRNEQPLQTYVIFNILDILGWELMFVCCAGSQYSIPSKIVLFWLPVLLASFHYTSTITSIMFYPMFKHYFLNSNVKSDIPSEKHWFRFRTTFLFMDAVVRAYVSVYIYNTFIHY